jgi:hypothetical protein
MRHLSEYSVTELRRIISIKDQIETFQGELDGIIGGQYSGVAKAGSSASLNSPRRMSAAARRKIGLAQKARWARVKEAKAAPIAPPTKKRRRMSKAGRAAIASAAKERWARFRAAQSQG